MIISGADFDEADFTLRWPRELFLYEVKQLLRRSDVAEFSERVAALCGEAFIDADIEHILKNASTASAWGASRTSSDDVPKMFLEQLITQPDLLKGYSRRVYYAERFDNAESTNRADLTATLATSFYHLISELAAAGYFPMILPKICVDDDTDWEPDPSDKISKSIKVPVTWPDDVRDNNLSKPVLYSVIEYFHDEAQRPRRNHYHNFGNCGTHHYDYSKRSGGVVYRWHVNELLQKHEVDLRLGNQGEEEGLLIRHASLSLDNLSRDVIAAVPKNDIDEKGKIESAIRLYRRWDSTIHDRRKAIASLADVLEHYRDEFKQIQFTRGDEGDLFQIFNKFTIRHGKKTDRNDYGDEYLDWIFWTTLAAIQLVHRLGISSEIQAEGSTAQAVRHS
ncbi:hypothetical protein [Nesterenkonia ebinurensis]|uniref:hypothetical protein n=1 Tax=Nesterenkonia ebinurensis TaxID=2608252 RepID=UPI00123E1E90|nr:hypothetical protein [Nesterenkonia ebinurensis]